MGHRDDRDNYARHRANLGGIDSAGVHDHLGLDGALVGQNATDAAICQIETRNPHALADAGPAAPRALGQGEGQAAGVEVAIGRKEGRADDAINRHQWEAPPRFCGTHQLERQTEAGSPSSLSFELLHALR